MPFWMLIGGVVVMVAALALMLKRKLDLDAIVQDGRRVGSAMLAQFVEPGTRQARFVIVRGEPAFLQDRPFSHQGAMFQIETFAALDASSTVLRRFQDVTCRVIQGGSA